MNQTLSTILGTGGLAALIGALTVLWRTRRVTNASIEARAQETFERLASEYRERLDAAVAELAGVRSELALVRAEAGVLEARVEGLLRKLREVTEERDEARRARAELLAEVGAGVVDAYARRPPPPPSEQTGRHVLRPPPLPAESGGSESS